MNTRVRYLLLLFGFIVFLLLAPLLVLYVRGVSFDFSSKTFFSTGLLAIRAEPENAEVWLNGQLVQNGDGDIRFLAPGEYELELKKEGYQSWKKRLPILSGQVTWANAAFKTIYLFFSQPKAQTVASRVLDFHLQDNQLTYLNEGSITVSQLKSLQNVTYPLPKAVHKILAADESGSNFILTDSSSQLLLFNASFGQITDLSLLFKSPPDMHFGANGRLYSLESNILYQVNPANKTKTALFKDIQAYFVLVDSLYMIQSDGEESSLIISQRPFSNSQVLVENLPHLTSPELLVSFEKEIFITSGGQLYLAGQQLQKLADNVTAHNFDPQNSTLAILHAGQLDYHAPLSNNLTFVTRFGEEIFSPIINSGTAGAFLIKNNQLMEIELDARDNQNQYTLYAGTDLQKFVADADGEEVVVLDNGELKHLIIR